MSETCHCGRPLHYSDPAIRRIVEDLIAATGDEYVVVTRSDDGRAWRVQRHYIALHGIKADELDTLGFEEIHELRAQADAVDVARRRGQLLRKIRGRLLEIAHAVAGTVMSDWMQIVGATLVMKDVEPGWAMIADDVPIGKRYLIDLERQKEMTMLNRDTGQRKLMTCVWVVDPPPEGYLPIVAFAIDGAS